MSTVFLAESMLESVEADDLRRLEQSSIQLGTLIHSHRGRPLSNGAHTRIQAPKSVASELTIYIKELTEEALAEAAARARNRPGLALFVGEHCIERSRALKVGFDSTVPHPQLIFEVLSGHDLRYVRLTGLTGEYRDNSLTRFLNLPSVPAYLSATEQGTAYVITSSRIAEILRTMGFGVTVFGKHHDPQTTDLYLVRDDRTVPEGINPQAYSREYLAQHGKEGYIVGYVDDALLMALDHKVSIEEIHFPVAKHGHSQRLMADTGLITSAVNAASLGPARTYESLPNEFQLTTRTVSSLTADEVKALQVGITRETIDRLHAPYVGRSLLEVGGKTHHIQSRHIKHPHNGIVTEGLLEHFEKIGKGFLKVKRCAFDIGGGQQFFNVEAELPGSEPGPIVIISAHFDSTALDVKDHYPAPGADDDASGMAGVLAAAEVAVRLRSEGVQLKRTIRFVLFNAEEGGVFGSLKYAAQQYLKEVKIAAVFQMDMIGFHGGKPTVFEIHAGYTPLPEVEAKSLTLAKTVKKAAEALSPSLVNHESPQIYPSYDRVDTAQGNSDHTRFHQYRYPACMISEDYSTDPGDPSPDPQYNKDYHMSSDKVIDCAYAAEIARAVAGAAILTAKG